MKIDKHLIFFTHPVWLHHLAFYFSGSRESPATVAEGQGYAPQIDQNWLDTTEKRAQTKVIIDF